MNAMMFDFGTQERLYRVKSPLNYVGGKFKLLRQLMEPHVHHDEARGTFTERGALIPAGARTFVDVFCGGFNVGANARAERVVGIDLDSDVIGLLEWMRDAGSDESVRLVKAIVAKHGLGRPRRGANGNGEAAAGANGGPIEAADANRLALIEWPPQQVETPDAVKASDGVKTEEEKNFLAMRRTYNAARFRGARRLDEFDMRAVLYALIAHGFNGHIRFSEKGGYNIPFGHRTFNEMLERNLAEFAERLHEENPRFINGTFEEVERLDLDARDFVYLDPPYLLTTAPYNESTGWDRCDDVRLYAMLDRLDDRGVRFGLSNVLEHKGRTNEILDRWSKRYRLEHLAFDYDTASYNLKEAGGPTREVFVTNAGA